MICLASLLAQTDNSLASDQAQAMPSVNEQQPESSQSPETKPRFGDWEMICKEQTKAEDSADKPAAKACRLQQAQAVNAGKDIVFLFNIARQGKQRVAIISTPLNGYLPFGLELKIDDAAPRHVIFETCNISGCHAGFALNSQLLSAMRKGKVLVVSMKDTKATAIPLSVSLNGISAGLDALDVVTP